MVMALALASTAKGDIVDDARASVAQLSAPRHSFEGPMRAPNYLLDQTILYLSTDERNPTSRLWGQALAEAAETLDWNLQIFDGRGNPLTWVDGMVLAIEVGVDGFITSVDMRSLRQLAEPMQRAKIPVVGLHAATLPGPDRELGLYTNVMPDPRAVGRAQADWMIADSDGSASVIMITDCTHPLACAQSTATTERLEECEGCTILETFDHPIEELPDLLPDAVRHWRQTYAAPVYVVAVADYFLDFIVPTLDTEDVPHEEIILVGADGSEAALERIRAGDRYQRLTTAEAHELEAWQAMDELIRALYGNQPSFWVRPPFLVTADNIDPVSREHNTLVPPYDFKAAYGSIWIPEEPEEEGVFTFGR